VGSEDDGDFVSETCYEDEEPVHRFVDELTLNLALFSDGDTRSLEIGARIKTHSSKTLRILSTTLFGLYRSRRFTQNTTIQEEERSLFPITTIRITIRKGLTDSRNISINLSNFNFRIKTS
jgi:hypothetical protein